MTANTVCIGENNLQPYDPKLSMYLVSRYDDLQKVMRDSDSYSLELGDMIDKIVDRGHADGVADLVMPVTIGVMCEQLGLAQIDGANIRRWSMAYVAQLGGIFNREQMLAMRVIFVIYRITFFCGCGNG